MNREVYSNSPLESFCFSSIYIRGEPKSYYKQTEMIAYAQGSSTTNLIRNSCLRLTEFLFQLEVS